MLLAFIYHITSLPVSSMCMWQCNWTASSTSEPTLQCSPFPMGAFPPLPTSVSCWRGRKADSKTLCQPLCCRAGRSQGGRPWAAAGPGCGEGALSLALVPPTGDSACLNSSLGNSKTLLPLLQHFVGVPSTLYFWKKDRRKTNRYAQESYRIRVSSQYLFGTNTNL